MLDNKYLILHKTISCSSYGSETIVKPYKNFYKVKQIRHRHMVS